jgi:ABC-type multidrug transport system fused ATPase/permease subunit
MMTMHLSHTSVDSIFRRSRTVRVEGTVEGAMFEATVIPASGVTGLRTAGSEPRSALKSDHLRRAVVGKVLVDDVSVEIRAGEVMAVVGPSGAGKSSFLRLLNRLDEPTGGTLRLDGRDYRELEPR